MADVTMPQLGETVTEGTITKWLKQVGEAIAVDEVLFEVSTDKVDSEVPSPATGVLSEIVVQEGETADVGVVLARISDSGEQVSNVAQEVELTQPAGSSVATATSIGDAGVSSIVSNSSNGNLTTQSASAAELEGLVLSPVVRKLINDNNIDVSVIVGTGAGGRITRSDVEKAIVEKGNPASGSATGVSQSSAPAPSYSQVSQSFTTPAVPEPFQPPRSVTLPSAVVSNGERDVVVPFSNIRRRTAEHMIMSQAVSAHTFVSIEVDYFNVDKVRLANKDKFKAEEGVGLTYLPFISRAVVDAIREYPFANSSVGVNELIVHKDVNVGIAVDLNFEGLLVPVLHGTDGLRLRQIARGISDLAYRPRNKKLQADDIAGGTFTITNAGGYGTFVTYPVINQPQVGILSTDGVKKKPVVVELPDGNDAIVVHPVGMLGFAWDHRAFDGAYASAFLARVKEVLETRNWAEEL